jgi:hypothetical protein
MKNTSENVKFNPLKYLNPIPELFHQNGGLSFNQPIFSDKKIILSFDKISGDYKDIIKLHANNPIIQDHDKTVSIDMITKEKFPIVFDSYADVKIHDKLSKELKNRGCMDMLISPEGSNYIVIPTELEPVLPIVNKMIAFEKHIKTDLSNYNIWLLVDTRAVYEGMTQRNSGFHYDGLNIGGRYRGVKNVAIYTWTNRLPTLYYTKGIKYDILKQNENKNRINMSIYSHMLVDGKYTIPSKSDDIVRMDGTTLHSADVAGENIVDRVFVRLCITGSKHWFDRLGNTENPFINYPAGFEWNNVCDPSVSLIQSVYFETPLEFKRLWDISCLGHSAFAICNEGYRSYQYKLLNEVKGRKGLGFIKDVAKLYNRSNSIEKFRSDILLHYNV